MAPLPKKRHSTQRKGKRRASIKLKKTGLIKCPNCGEPVKPHMVCKNCGVYKTESILTIEDKLSKKEKEQKKQEPKK